MSLFSVPDAHHIVCAASFDSWESVQSSGFFSCGFFDEEVSSDLGMKATGRAQLLRMALVGHSSSDNRRSNCKRMRRKNTHQYRVNFGNSRQKVLGGMRFGRNEGDLRVDEVQIDIRSNEMCQAVFRTVSP